MDAFIWCLGFNKIEEGKTEGCMKKGFHIFGIEIALREVSELSS